MDISTKRTVRIEVTKIIELTVADEVLAEVMSDDWQHTFYSFSTENEALAWLGWVIDEWGGPQHVDGLANFTDEQASTRKEDLEYYVA